MSRGVNKVILLGYLGGDPDIRYTQGGGAVANISLATSEAWRDKQSGEMRENTEWHRVVIFGKLAEIAGEYLRKGSQVYIEGQLRTRKWQDKNGAERYSTEIIVSGAGGSMQMLGGGGGNGNGSTGNRQNAVPHPVHPVHPPVNQQPKQQPKQNDYQDFKNGNWTPPPPPPAPENMEPFPDDEIPF